MIALLCEERKRKGTEPFETLREKTKTRGVATARVQKKQKQMTQKALEQKLRRSSI
jgi:hypothetical protein